MWWILCSSIGVIFWGLVRSLMARRHSQRYCQHLQSSDWHQRRDRTLALTRGRCALIPLLSATHAHHLHYRNLQRELALRDLVPLSRFGHWVVHWFFIWHVPPLRWLCNGYLRLATLLVSMAVRPLFVILLVAVIVIWYVAAR